LFAISKNRRDPYVASVKNGPERSRPSFLRHRGSKTTLGSNPRFQLW
jgi:hypothetical protein